MRQQNVAGNDKFERVEFTSEGIDKGEHPKVTIRLNDGTFVEFPMASQSAAFEALAQWATETAAELKALGK